MLPMLQILYNRIKFWNAVSMTVSNVAPGVGAGDPTLNAPNITQTNRKFIRIFGTT